MKLAKKTDEGVILVEVENGIEVGGTRSEQGLYADGFKKACLSPSETGEWTEYPTCFVQEWKTTDETINEI